MVKYLEQTAWLLNHKPDGRKSGRWTNQCFVPGTRWEFDEDTGELSGDGMAISGPHADEIRAVCKEVEPGFGVLVGDYNYEEVIGRLIDEGTITVTDLQNALKDDDDDQEEVDDEDELSKKLRRHLLNREMYKYRHWLRLDPPSDKLIEAVAEDEKRDAIHREYEERTKR